MELKNTELEVNDMLLVYESLHRCDIIARSLPALELPDPAKATLEAATLSRYTTDQEVLQALESLRASFANLKPRIEKFQKRLDEKDPITGNPRYGPNAASRVQNLLALHKILRKATMEAFGLSEEEADETVSAQPNSIVNNLRMSVQAKEEAQRQSQLNRAKEEQKRLEERRQQEEQQRLEELRRQKEAEEKRRQEEAELNRRANEIREANKRAEEAAAQAERDWIDSIPKGPEGVRKQIQILKEDTKDDLEAQKTALKSLLTIFSQIAQHPEEINFRRIRRDHPKFHEDIGRHKGGREILIAAGFKLTTLDDVPVFFSKEPDLETEMDEWSQWFDNLKATLEVVKEMQ